MNILGGIEILWIFLGVISMHLWSFLRVKVQNGGYFGGMVKFQIFLGCLKFLIFFLESTLAGP